MSTYDWHAADYDATRGGAPRASAAAEAISPLLPQGDTVLDLATGTGIVELEFRRRGHAATCPPTSPYGRRT
ncbi:hypothetical protein [Tsukamurella hominis]|uniref:hypothetical protein n=1 Tax=Tsukamurella hominis TaxID=1970232 RepID=UPI0039ED0C72